MSNRWHEAPGENDRKTTQLFIAACGYEERASNAIVRICGELELSVNDTQLVVFDYCANGVLSYDRNRSVFAKYDAEFFTEIDQLAEVLGRFHGTVEPVSVIVDYSSMDRELLGGVCLSLARSNIEFLVEFVYSPAAYTDGLTGSSGVVTANEALSGYEGWAGDPARPVGVVMGVGYESDLMLAALEALEPRTVATFVPKGFDARYDEELRDRNPGYLDHEVVDYSLSHPRRLLRQLDKLTHRLMESRRVVLLPMGPKIFAVAAVLIALRYAPGVAVWRVSAAELRTPEERRAAGELVAFSVIFSRKLVDEEEAVSFRDV